MTHLASIASLAVLLGIAVPAIQSAQLASHHAQVAENLRALGQGALDFAAASGGAPPAGLADLRGFVAPRLADLLEDGAEGGYLYAIGADPADPSGRRPVVTAAPAVAGISGDLVCRIDAALALSCDPARP